MKKDNKAENVGIADAAFDTAVLKYPKDAFDLLSVDRIIYHAKTYNKHDKYSTKYRSRYKSIYITLRCKKCGTIKKVVDKANIGCKSGPCSKHWKDLTGKQFGHLTALRYVFMPFCKGRKAGWYWECKCDCGSTAYRSSHGLLNGGVIWCTKCAINATRHKITKPNNRAAWNSVFTIYRRNAAKRLLDFKLTDDEVRRICSEPCYYCGALPSIPLKSGRGRAVVGFRNGIDRLDSTGAYVLKNCVSCCPRCNQMKSDLGYNEWLQHMQVVINHCKERSTTIPEGSTPKRAETDPVRQNSAQDIV